MMTKYVVLPSALLSAPDLIGHSLRRSRLTHQTGPPPDSVEPRVGRVESFPKNQKSVKNVHFMTLTDRDYGGGKSWLASQCEGWSKI